MRLSELFPILILAVFFHAGRESHAQDETLPALLHDALAASLAGNPERVASIRAVAAEDHAEDPDSWSGLLDDLVALEILTATSTQREKALGLRNHASQINDPVARERLLELAERVEDYQLLEYRRKRKLNTAIYAVNRSWQTASQVVAGQPRALLVAGVDLYYWALGKKEPSITDKRTAYLAKLRQTRGTASPREEEWDREFIRKVDTKKSRALQRRWEDLVESAIDSGEWNRARRLGRIGTRLWPTSSVFSQGFARIETLEAKEVIEKNADLDSADPGSPHEDAAKAPLLQRRLLEPLDSTRVSTDRPARERIRDAYAQRWSETLDYLLFGGASSRALSKRTAQTVAARGADAPTSLAFFQGLETALRGVTLLFGNELGLDDAIDAYATAERETPGVLSQEDRLSWADLCAKRGDYAQALEVLEAGSVANPKRVRKYRERWAKAIVTRCKELPPTTDRFRALDFVRTHLGDTAGAQKASDLLAESPATDRPLLRVDLTYLQEFKRLLLDGGFTLERAWWDGQPGNGEISEDVVFWDPEGAVWYRVGKRSAWRKLQQPEANVTQLSAIFAVIEESIVARKLSETRRQRRRFPVELEGGLGSDTYVTPKLVPLDVRKDDDYLFE